MERRRKTKSCGSGSIDKVFHLCDEVIAYDILSRLPVKSLMRFKCVCKTWLSLIHKDRHFIDLHFTRSHTGGSASLLIMKRVQLFAYDWYLLSAELQLLSKDGDRGGAAVQNKLPLSYGSDIHMLEPINGLICLMNKHSHSVCIHNPSTRESTPWVKSFVKLKQEAEGDPVKAIWKEFFNHLYFNHFGYDPTTKDYKVLSLWMIKRSDSYIPREEYCVSEVFSLRHKSWRLIDAIPPISPYCLYDPVCVNGSLYWLHSRPEQTVIVQFNFGSEKFKTIPVPKFIINDIRYPYETAVMELGGRLALLAKKIYFSRVDDTPVTRVIKNKSNSMKMWILNDDQGNSQPAISNNFHWIEESFPMPPFDWEQEWVNSIIPVQGTELIILRLLENFSFYYYNWKKKSYSRKFDLNGIESFIDKNVVRPDNFWFYTFTENLLPLN